MKRVLTGLVVAVLVSVGAGCGDDDGAEGDQGAGDGGEATEAPITKTEFVDAANQICIEGEAALADVEEPKSLEEATALVEDRLIPSLRQQLEDIRDLGFPEEDRDQLEDLFDRTEAALDEVEADVEGALESEEDPFAEVTDELDEYGLDECAT